MINQKKINELHQLMKFLNIEEKDIEEKFVVGTGRGGQKLHKSSTCVYLKHLPTGIEIKCQKTRSREDNRFFARRLLCEAFREKILGAKSEKQKEIEKIRRQKKARFRKHLKKQKEPKNFEVL